MRRIILFKVFLLTFTITYSQNHESVNNFHIENNQVVWKKVFETSLDYGQLCSKVKDSGLFKNLEEGKTKIRGELKYIDADPLESGMMDFSTASFIIDNFIQGFVIIEYKTGKYRVILKRMMLTEKSVDSLKITGASLFIEREVFKYGKIEFNNQFKNRSSKRLNDFFTQYFDFDHIIYDDNW